VPLTCRYRFLVEFPDGTSTHNVDNQATVSSSDADPLVGRQQHGQFPLARGDGSTVHQPADHTGVNNGHGQHGQHRASCHRGGYVTAGGTLDTGYTGTVTLSFANNPGNAKFVVGGSPTPTMTAQASERRRRLLPRDHQQGGFRLHVDGDRHAGPAQRRRHPTPLTWPALPQLPGRAAMPDGHLEPEQRRQRAHRGKGRTQRHDHRGDLRRQRRSAHRLRLDAGRRSPHVLW